MPQLSLYLDDPMMEGLRQDASREGKMLSKFVAGVSRSTLRTTVGRTGSSTCTALARTACWSSRQTSLSISIPFPLWSWRSDVPAR